MFHINDTVLYGADGVCTVTNIQTLTFGGEAAEYYILSPVHQQRAVIYVPTASETLRAKMRRVLSAEEIHALLDEIAATPYDDWIANEIARRDQFRETLHGGDRRALLRMIRTIYHHGQEQKAVGRKLHHSDEIVMKEAEKLFHDELAYVLGLSPDDVGPYITQRLKA